MLRTFLGPVINPGKSKKDATLAKLINEHGLTITDNIKIADEFNKYFSSVGNQLAKEIKSNKSYKIYLKIINKLDSKKSSEMDNIKAKLLKECGTKLCKVWLTPQLKLCFWKLSRPT